MLMLWALNNLFWIEIIKTSWSKTTFNKVYNFVYNTHGLPPMCLHLWKQKFRIRDCSLINHDCFLLIIIIIIIIIWESLLIRL